MGNTYCIVCGKPKSKRNKYFCSNSCQMIHTNRTANPAKTPAARAKISRAAKLRGNAHLMTPDIREKAALGISKANRGRVLSAEHKKHIGEGVKRAGNIPPANTHLVGPNHPNWIDGSSKIRNKDFYSPGYIEFRAVCLERDNWTCQDCGSKGGKLEVHHIKPWGPFPDLRHDPDNGITLCRRCHLLRHRNQPRPITIGPRVVADLYSSQNEP